MTVFSMPYLPKPADCLLALNRLWRCWPRRICTVVCMLAVLCGIPAQHAHAQSAHAQGSSNAITDIRFDSSEDAVRMSGNVRFALSESLHGTLEKGVPVYFLFETSTSRSRWYWADKVVYSRKRHIRLMYQPLTRRWRVNVSSEPFSRGLIGVVLNQNYDSLDAALSSIQRISAWQVLDAPDWSGEGSYTVLARFRIDLSQLQRPLQLGTVGQSDWKLDIERSFRLTQQDLGKPFGGN